MAAFTSTQNGNWNDGATWGNDSPGVKGTDWPGLAGDTASISHIVTYNVSETNELGQITIANGGILTFLTSSSTKLTLGQQDILIQSGGELKVGESGTVIASGNTAELIWNTTIDNQKGININNGGKLTIYGDPVYYGSDDKTTLADDAENTDGDTIIKTVDDMSALWNIGDEITIKVENIGDITSYKDAIKVGTIQSFNGTLITLDINITAVAGVGDTWISPVVNVTRNVKLLKLGASTAIYNYNTNRPIILDVNVSGNNNCTISNAMLTGFVWIDSNYDFQFLSSVTRNGYYGINGGSNHTISGNIYSNYYGLISVTNSTVSANIYASYVGCSSSEHITISGDMYSNYYGMHSCNSDIISSNVYSNMYGFRRGTNATISSNMYFNYYASQEDSNCIVTGNVYSNQHGFSNDVGMVISGRIGYNANDISKPNTTTDFFTNVGHLAHTLFNAKLPLAGLLNTKNVKGYTFRLFCEHHNRAANAHRIYDNVGNITKIACDAGGDRPSQDPDGGNSDCIELGSIQSLCSIDNPLKAWKRYGYRIWATNAAGAKTYTFKIQTTYAGISAGGLKLTAEYPDGISNGSLSTQTNAPTINQRSDAADWTQTLAVTVTPGIDGWIDFMIELMEYESGNEVYIWSTVVIT